MSIDPLLGGGGTTPVGGTTPTSSPQQTTGPQDTMGNETSQTEVGFPLITFLKTLSDSRGELKEQLNLIQTLDFGVLSRIFFGILGDISLFGSIFSTNTSEYEQYYADWESLTNDQNSAGNSVNSNGSAYNSTADTVNTNLDSLRSLAIAYQNNPTQQNYDAYIDAANTYNENVETTYNPDLASDYNAYKGAVNAFNSAQSGFNNRYDALNEYQSSNSLGIGNKTNPQSSISTLSTPPSVQSAPLMPAYNPSSPPSLNFQLQNVTVLSSPVVATIQIPSESDFLTQFTSVLKNVTSDTINSITQTGLDVGSKSEEEDVDQTTTSVLPEALIKVTKRIYFAAVTQQGQQFAVSSDILSDPNFENIISTALYQEFAQRASIPLEPQVFAQLQNFTTQVLANTTKLSVAPSVLGLGRRFLQLKQDSLTAELVGNVSAIEIVKKFITSPELASTIEKLILGNQGNIPDGAVGLLGSAVTASLVQLALSNTAVGLKLAGLYPLLIGNVTGLAGVDPKGLYFNQLFIDQELAKLFQDQLAGYVSADQTDPKQAVLDALRRSLEKDKLRSEEDLRNALSREFSQIIRDQKDLQNAINLAVSILDGERRFALLSEKIRSDRVDREELLNSLVKADDQQRALIADLINQSDNDGYFYQRELRLALLGLTESGVPKERAVKLADGASEFLQNLLVPDPTKFPLQSPIVTKQLSDREIEGRLREYLQGALGVELRDEKYKNELIDQSIKSIFELRDELGKAVKDIRDLWGRTAAGRLTPEEDLRESFRNFFQLSTLGLKIRDPGRKLSLQMWSMIFADEKLLPSNFTKVGSVNV